MRRCGGGGSPEVKLFLPESCGGVADAITIDPTSLTIAAVKGDYQKSCRDHVCLCLIVVDGYG